LQQSHIGLSANICLGVDQQTRYRAMTAATPWALTIPSTDNSGCDGGAAHEAQGAMPTAQEAVHFAA
jgi:hypothetical protein